jgi:hypothetical protein
MMAFSTSKGSLHFSWIEERGWTGLGYRKGLGKKMGAGSRKERCPSYSLPLSPFHRRGLGQKSYFLSFPVAQTP